MMVTPMAIAATYQYKFEDNILDPNFSIKNPSVIPTEKLSAPFGTMSVSDEDGGIRVDFANLELVQGDLSTLNFQYLPALNGLHQTDGPGLLPPEGGAYFYTDSEQLPPYNNVIIGGWGGKYAPDDLVQVGTMEIPGLGNLPIVEPKESAMPSTYYFDFGPHYTIYDSYQSFTIHLRGLPSALTAAAFVPQYLTALDTSYGTLPHRSSAAILASAVPELGTSALMALGLAALAVGSRRKMGVKG